LKCVFCWFWFSGEADDDDEVDDEDEEDKPSSKPKSKASAAKSTKSSSSIAKSKFGQSATNPDKPKSEANGEAPWKQGPWAFLRDIKDVRGLAQNHFF
jgi:cytoskeletal protein RodZ